MIFLFLLGTFFMSIVGIVYFIYFINLPSDSAKAEILDDDKLPKISIVIPAHNEEKNIERRIENIANCSYPLDKVEVVIVNDASEDDTYGVGLDALGLYDLTGTVVNNQNRLGVNKTMERGIVVAENDIVVCTDADVSFDRDAVKQVVSKLISKYEIGGVSGDLQPFVRKKNTTTQTEQSYRSVYGGMCEWESNIASTYCFNGALYAFKKYAPKKLHIETGSYDAGIALSIIRNGFRTCYLQSAKVFENNIPQSLREQVRQKIRRASRLIRATGNNLDLLWKHRNDFSNVVFPLRILAFFVVPFCFFAGVAVWLYILSLFDLLLISLPAFVLFGVFSIKYPTIISTFIIHQFYLLCGLFNYFGQKETWRLVRRE